MKPKKILLLSVSAGAGHVRAAEAIRAFGVLRDEPIDIAHIDVMSTVSIAFRKLYTDLYIQLVNNLPTAWGYLYRFSNDATPDKFAERFRRLVERVNTRALRKEIQLRAPDAIICTHFLPAEMLANSIKKGDLHCPVWVQVTDFDLHRLWVHQGMAGYFAANDEVAFRMRACGIAANTIHVTGIPIMPAFSRALSRETCALAMGLNPHLPTILLMGGGAGLGSLDKVAEQLLAIPAEFQLLVLAGSNVEALAALQTRAKNAPDRLFPHGFTKEVERLMICADLVITKPGGLTSSECLAMGLPMIVNSPIPGQEERNADFLLEEGVALKAFDAVTLAYRVGRLLKDPQKLAAMRRNARALGKPNAAKNVIDIVMAARR